jgi:selenocysteine lyase/cysteine desulfurase
VASPFPPDDERLQAVREALPAVGAGIYLDTATAGPLPAETVAAMAELATWEGRTGRASAAFMEESASRLEEARAAIAAVTVADVDEIAMAPSPSAALLAVAASIPWRAGDRLVTVSRSHAPALSPIARLATALGLAVIEVPLEAGVEAFEAALGADVRLVVIPHVSAATGERLPVAAIADLARRHEAQTGVDGSLAVGAVPVDVPSLGVDAYALAGDAWLLGPAGVAAMWVRERPARRLDLGGWYRPAVAGLARSIGWLSMYVGLGWLQERASALAVALVGQFSAVPGVHVLTPAERVATIVTFRIEGWPAEEALDELSARVFLIARTIPELDGIRLSVAGFTSAAELDRLLGAVRLLAAHGPGRLPARRSLTIVHGEGG